MNVLDENIFEPQRRQLEAWKIHVRQIGVEIGRTGMDDREEIIPLLHTLRRPTLFTRDRDFYDPWLRHPGYCLVFLEIKPDETAQFIRRFLRHSMFRNQAQRMGKVVRVHEDGIGFWQVKTDKSQEVAW
ncbi:MAG: hypothetical protein ACREEM_25880 [Blastocatellia bacterium]